MMCSDSRDKVTDSVLSFSMQIILSSLLTSLFGELCSMYFLLPSPPKTPVRACMLSRFSFIRLFAAPWTVARQAPLSMGFSQQEYCRGLPCPLPRDLPRPGMEYASLVSPALAGVFFTTSATWEAHKRAIDVILKY